MKWLADENISGHVIRFLREVGHDVVSVRETKPGLSDEGVIALARQQGRVLLSFDRDHGDLIFKQGVAPPPAVVYIRLYPSSPEALVDILKQALAPGENALMGCFTVVTRDGLRQRRLP